MVTPSLFIMKTYKTEGILIQQRQLKEADKLAIIWTPDKGKRSYVVKGANKILSRKTTALDTMNLIRFTAVPTKTEHHLLVEADLINDFSNLKNNYEAIGSIMYMLEALDKFLANEETQLIFYNWFKTLLLDFSANPSRATTTLLYFQMQLLVQTGYSPLLDSCIYCYQELKPDEPRVASDNNEPGYICEKHFDNISPNFQLISDTIIKIQRYFFNCDSESAYNLKLTADQAHKIFCIQNTWIEAISEHNINSKTLLNIWKTPTK